MEQVVRMIAWTSSNKHRPHCTVTSAMQGQARDVKEAHIIVAQLVCCFTSALCVSGVCTHMTWLAPLLKFRVMLAWSVPR